VRTLLGDSGLVMPLSSYQASFSVWRPSSTPSGLDHLELSVWIVWQLILVQQFKVSELNYTSTHQQLSTFVGLNRMTKHICRNRTQDQSTITKVALETW